MDRLFYRDLVRKLERRRPIDSSYQPSRRYDDCMVPGEQPGVYSSMLIIIDGSMSSEPATRLMEHLASAIEHVRLAMHGTRFNFCLWADSNCENGGLTKPVSSGLNHIASCMKQVYAHVPNNGEFNTLFDEAERLKRCDMTVLLTDGGFLQTFNEVITPRPIFKRTLILLSEDAPADAEQRLHAQRLSNRAAVLRLLREADPQK